MGGHDEIYAGFSKGHKCEMKRKQSQEGFKQCVAEAISIDNNRYAPVSF